MSRFWSPNGPITQLVPPSVTAVIYKLVVDTPGYQDQCRLWVP